MDNRQTNRYDAAVAGDHVLTANATIIAGDAPLLALQSTLQAEIVKIETDNAKQLRNKGYSAQKVADVHTMGLHAWAICKVVEEYAKALPDPILQHKVAFHKSDLLHGTVAEMKKNAQIVYDNTNPIIGAIVAAGYNITALQVTQLQTDITTVSSEEGNPIADVAATQAATTALALDFKPLKDTEESIHNLMTPYAATNLDFYNAVMDGFEIVNFGQRNIAARIIVSDNATNTRLELADVTLSIADVVPAKKSSKRGIADFSHPDVPEGNYTLQVKLRGYQDFTLTNVAIFNNRMTRIEVKLIKI